MKIKQMSTSLSWIVAFILLLTTLLSVRSVSAATNQVITLSQTSGFTGSAIIVSGHDFTPNYYYYIFGAQRILLGKGTIDSSGSFTYPVTIISENSGHYEIMVYASVSKPSPANYNSDYNQGAVAFFTVIPTPNPTIMLYPSTGKPGSSINVSGQNFKPNYFYYLFFEEKVKAKGTIDSSGNFAQSFVIPGALDIGGYTITTVANKIEDSSPSITRTYDENAATYFTVVYLLPEVSLDNNQGKVADTFTLNGSDFSSGDSITVYWDGSPLGSTIFPTTSNTFENRSFSVPHTYGGSHAIKVANTTQQVTLNYTVIPDITLSSNSLVSGDQILISATGFAAKSTVTFYLDNATLTEKSVSDDEGTLTSQIVTLSAVSLGSHILKAQDASGNSAAKEISVLSPQPSATSTATSTTTPTVTATTQAPTTPAKTTPSTTQTKPPTKTSTSMPPQTTQSSSSTFPVWGIITLIIIGLVVVVAVIVLVSRRKSLS